MLFLGVVMVGSVGENKCLMSCGAGSVLLTLTALCTPQDLMITE